MPAIDKASFNGLRQACEKEQSSSSVADKLWVYLDNFWKDSSVYSAKDRPDAWTVSFREFLGIIGGIWFDIPGEMLQCFLEERRKALSGLAVDPVYQQLLPWVEDVLLAEVVRKFLKDPAASGEALDVLSTRPAELSQRLLSKEPHLASLFTPERMKTYLQEASAQPKTPQSTLLKHLEGLKPDQLLTLLQSNTELTCALLSEEEIVKLATIVDKAFGVCAESVVDHVVSILIQRTSCQNRPSLVDWQQALERGSSLLGFDEDLFYQGIGHVTTSRRLVKILGSGHLLSRRRGASSAIAVAADDQLLGDCDFISTFVGFNRKFCAYQFSQLPCFQGKQIVNLVFNASVLRDPETAQKGRLKMVDFLAPLESIQLMPELSITFELCAGKDADSSAVALWLSNPSIRGTQEVLLPLLDLVKVGLDDQLTSWVISRFEQVVTQEIGQGHDTSLIRSLRRYLETLQLDTIRDPVRTPEVMARRREFIRRVCAYSEINIRDRLSVDLTTLDHITLGGGRVLRVEYLRRAIQAQDWERLEREIEKFPEAALLPSVRTAFPERETRQRLARWVDALKQVCQGKEVGLGRVPVGEQLVFAVLAGLIGRKGVEVSRLPERVQAEFLDCLNDVKNCHSFDEHDGYPDEKLLQEVFKRGIYPLILWWRGPLGELGQRMTKEKTVLIAHFGPDLQEGAEAYSREQERRMAEEQKRAPLLQVKEGAVSYDPFSLYVPLDVQDKKGHTASRIPLFEVTTRFLSSDNPARVLLVWGDAGSGKSLAMKELKRRLVHERELDSKKPRVIDLELKSFHKTEVGRCLFQALEKQGLTVEQVAQEPLVILLDGYDEVGRQTEENLYRSHGLEQWKQLKLVISCRGRYLRTGYQGWFAPYRGTTLWLEGLEEANLAPFSEQQIETYVTKFVKSQSGLSYSLEQYQKQLQDPRLKHLITNPFMLWILVESLSEFVTYAKSGKPINRASLYDCFIRYWFVKHGNGVRESSELPEGWKAEEHFRNFSEWLAILLRLRGQVEVDYPEDEESEVWTKYLNSTNLNVIRARRGCPLQKSGEGRYSFMHKSFLEYFAACYLMRVLDHPARLAMKLAEREEDPLKPKHLETDGAVLEFLKDRMELEPGIPEICFKSELAPTIGAAATATPSTEPLSRQGKGLLAAAVFGGQAFRQVATAEMPSTSTARVPSDAASRPVAVVRVSDESEIPPSFPSWFCMDGSRRSSALPVAVRNVTFFQAGQDGAPKKSTETLKVDGTSKESTGSHCCCLL